MRGSSLLGEGVRADWYRRSRQFIRRCFRRHVTKCSRAAVHAASHPIRLLDLPPSVTDGLEFLFGFLVINTYGMTEAASQIAADPLERRKPGSVGGRQDPKSRSWTLKGNFTVGTTGEIALQGADNYTRLCKRCRGHQDYLFTMAGSEPASGIFDDDEILFIAGQIKDIIEPAEDIRLRLLKSRGVRLSHAGVADAAVFSIGHLRPG